MWLSGSASLLHEALERRADSARENLPVLRAEGDDNGEGGLAMSDERQAGFYWVRLYQGADWEVANYHGDGRSWQVLGEDQCFDTEDIFEIGGRIERTNTEEAT
jgi:hypothetical protein